MTDETTTATGAGTTATADDGTAPATAVGARPPAAGTDTRETPATETPTSETPVPEPDALPPVRFWPALDLTSAAFDPVLAELMREGPVTRIRLPNGEGWAWLVTRHDDVRMVTNDARFSREAVIGRQITRLAPHFIPVPGAVGFADPPDHTRLRRAVTPAFSARGVQAVRRRARAVLDGLVDGMLADGPPADLTGRVLGPFPIAVICELMGVPARDHERMHAWTQRILSSSHGAAVSERAKDEMAAYFARLVRERHGSTGRDVASLLGAAVGRGELTVEEAVGLAVLLQIGGEAVTNNSGQMFYLLLTRPELAERMRAEPAVRPSAVEELLRWIPHRSAVGLSRIATEDVVIKGVRIRAGEPVYVSYLAANRDPDVFPDPDVIDVERGPNPHVAFGHGPHHCPGAILARMEAELLVDVLLDRLPGLRLAVPDDEVPWRRGALIRGPEALPVTW